MGTLTQAKWLLTYVNNKYTIKSKGNMSIINKGVNYMVRPRKWRKVCCLPESTRFGPLNTSNHEGYDEDQFVIMTIDEYETVRLIDLEGFTQEECASHMNIARTTVQRIYNVARKKLAESLVNGKVLRIEGGDYQLCTGLEKTCWGKGCRKRRHINDFINTEDE